MGSLRESIAALRTVGPIPTGVIVLTVEYLEEADMWVGQCLELGTPAEAATLKELRTGLAQAVGLQLQQMEELGYIGEFLNDHGVAILPLADASPSVRQGPSWRVPEPSAV